MRGILHLVGERNCPIENMYSGALRDNFVSFRYYGCNSKQLDHKSSFSIEMNENEINPSPPPSQKKTNNKIVMSVFIK